MFVNFFGISIVRVYFSIFYFIFLPYFVKAPLVEMIDVQVSSWQMPCHTAGGKIRVKHVKLKLRHFKLSFFHVQPNKLEQCNLAFAENRVIWLQTLNKLTFFLYIKDGSEDK